MSLTKIEFAVQMTCESCVESVKKSLTDVRGIKSVDIDLGKESVVVESNLPTLNLLNLLESTGKNVAVKGYAGNTAAVCILESGAKDIQGVIRFVQVTQQICIIDGTIDGLRTGRHHLCVHENGDISEGCESIGDIYNPRSDKNGRIYGYIGCVMADKDGRAAFRLEDDVIKVSDIIGRSFVITDETADGEIGKRLACGIVARSAGLFQNPKKICACDGISIWDEVSKPKSTL